MWSISLWVMGSPPRVRSRRRSMRNPDFRPGITSACAEQTRHVHRWCPHLRDHLRVCGADSSDEVDDAPQQGSPPRVRSRPVQVQGDMPVRGITSACAEQTSRTWSTRSATRDHLRVCGADLVFVRPCMRILGSPPRVRSRLRGSVRREQIHGITSACAEQTFTRKQHIGLQRDHLRVCGADSGACPRVSRSPGSPPRVRSRPCWVYRGR